MITQLIQLAHRPHPGRLVPVKNAPLYNGSDIKRWLLQRYTGNKPSGGLWTSTYTPDAPECCDWHAALVRNIAVQAAHPGEGYWWSLMVKKGLAVLPIATIEDVRTFTQRYMLSRVPIPPAMRSGIGILLTTVLTDWERALRDYDAIQVSGEAIDELLSAKFSTPAVKLAHADTAFDTWNAESTFWGKWCFSSCELFRVM